MFRRRRARDWKSYVASLEKPEIVLDDRTTARLYFLNVDQKTLESIQQAKGYFENNLTEIIDKVVQDIFKEKHFYERVQETIGEKRFKRNLSNYLERFFSGKIDKAYINSRVEIGKIHSEIHLTANFFIMAHQRMFQYLKAILMQKLHRHPNEMIELVVAIDKLATYDKQLIIDVYHEETFKEFLYDISHLLNSMTELDTTEQLIDSMDEQITEVHNITAGTQEMSSSIQEVSDHSIRVAEGTDEAVSAAEHSREVIFGALQDISQVGNIYNEVLNEVNSLAKAIDQTQNIINVINEIAEQTNLLALNASIEAARAGEVGQGFAVVAGEVRNLSEHTKEQITQITSNMMKLHEVSNQVIHKIEETGESVEKSVTASNQASSELEKIINTMKNINHETTQIAAMSEEQASTIVEINERNENMYERSQDVQKVAVETATIIYDISKQMDEYRLKFINTDIISSSKDIVKIAITDHLLWKWRVYNTLLGLDKISVKEIDSHKDCRLGKWYYDDLPDKITKLQPYIDLEQPHTEVHNCARYAIEQYHEGNTIEARNALKRLERASEHVVEHLTSLTKLL